jgi:predicted MPP superfamily phosphohydrolase
MVTFKQYLTEHWITKRKESATGWITKTGKFINAISSHCSSKYISQFEPDLINNGGLPIDNMKECLRRGNIRILQVDDKIYINAISKPLAQRGKQILLKHFPDLFDKEFIFDYKI